MKIETEKMMEAFVNHGWETEEKSDLLELINVDKTRRLFYLSREDNGRAETLIGLSFFDESRGGWVDVFEVCLLETALQQSIIHIMTRNLLDEIDGVEARLYFGSWGQKSVREYGFPYDDLPGPTRRSIEDAAELMYRKSDTLLELDREVTVNLFIEQVVRGEMTRPILVSEGVLKEDWCFRPAEEFLRMAENSRDPIKEKIYKAVARILAERQRE